MATQSFRRSQWNRILELDDRIRRRLYPSATGFARDWEVARRTVLRDIEFLRGRGAPLEFDHARRGFYYENPAWTLSALELTEGELLELAVVQRLLSQYEGTPLAETLDAVFAKIRAALPERVSVDPVMLDREFSFHGQPVRPITAKVWGVLVRGVRAHRAVRGRYRPYGENTAHAVDLEPLHVACVHGEWYAVMRWPKGYVGHFAVSRFESLRLLARTFEPADFDAERYFANRFGRFVGQDGKQVKVVVRFSKQLAPAIIERRWHANQSVRRLRTGELELSFPVPTKALLAVKGWVLQWGADARAMAPAELVRAVEDEVRAMGKLAGAGHGAAPAAT